MIDHLTLTEATNRACEEPTMLEALAWICVWESERIVAQAKRMSPWDTCFKISLRSVINEWTRRHAEEIGKIVGDPVVGERYATAFLNLITKKDPYSRLQALGRKNGKTLMAQAQFEYVLKRKGKSVSFNIQEKEKVKNE